MSDTKDAKLVSTLTSNLMQFSQVHINLTQDVIITTEDRLRGLLRDYEDCLSVKDRWWTPASVLITLVFVLSTSNFHDALGIPQATWQAICIICTVLCVIWLIKTGFQAFSARKSIENVITDIKKDSVESAN